MFSYSNGLHFRTINVMQTYEVYKQTKKKWKQVVYVKGNISILMVQGVVPKNTNILCTHK